MKVAKAQKKVEPVKVNTIIKNKVSKHIVGTDYTLGTFYDEAAEEKLKQAKTKK
jgi:hypothetical protein